MNVKMNKILNGSKEAGMSIVEMMMVLGITGALGLGVTQLSTLVFDNVRTIDYATEIVRLKYVALRLGQSVGVITVSSGSSPQLSQCLNGAVCPINREFPYTLYENGRPFAGPPSSPVRYTRNGETCTNAADSNCLFEATATFKALCLTSGCTRPNMILSTIRFFNTQAGGGRKLVGEVSAAAFLRSETKMAAGSKTCGNLPYAPSYPIMVNAIRNGDIECALRVPKIDGPRGPVGRDGPRGDQGNRGPRGPKGDPPTPPW